MHTRGSAGRFRFAIAFAVAVTLTLVSCSETSPSSAPTSVAASTAPETSPAVETAGSTPSPTTSIPADEPPAAGGLAGLGLLIVADEASVGAEEHMGLVITDVQARRLSADAGPGDGLLGGDLDRLAPPSDGAPPSQANEGGIK